jgi:hypothetical protein
VSFRLASLDQSVPTLPYGANAFTMTLSAGDTVETYKFYKKGLAGTQVAQWVITYTDSSRSVIASGLYTDLSVD